MTYPYSVGTLEVHEIGARRKLVATVRDEDGTLTDPSVLTFTMREPDNIRTTYVLGANAELAYDSPGVYHVYWDCMKVGKHRWRYAASGNVGAAAEAAFVVEASDVLA